MYWSYLFNDKIFWIFTAYLIVNRKRLFNFGSYSRNLYHNLKSTQLSRLMILTFIGCEISLIVGMVRNWYLNKSVAQKFIRFKIWIKINHKYLHKSYRISRVWFPRQMWSSECWQVFIQEKPWSTWLNCRF